MPLLIPLLGLFFPRLVIFLLWLFAPGFLAPAFDDNFLLLLVGFIFLPLTTLIYAFVGAPGDGGVQGFALIALVVGVLLDLGIIGGPRYRR